MLFISDFNIGTRNPDYFVASGRERTIGNPRPFKTKQFIHFRCCIWKLPCHRAWHKLPPSSLTACCFCFYQLFVKVTAMPDFYNCDRVGRVIYDITYAVVTDPYPPDSIFAFNLDASRRPRFRAQSLHCCEKTVLKVTFQSLYELEHSRQNDDFIHLSRQPRASQP